MQNEQVPLPFTRGISLLKINSTVRATSFHGNEVSLRSADAVGLGNAREQDRISVILFP